MDSTFGYIKAGFKIYSAIHMNREDAVCVIHTYTIEGMAVSAQNMVVNAQSKVNVFLKLFKLSRL